MTDSGAMTADDRLAIMDLFARYAWACDTGDVETFLTLFVPDAVYGLSDGRYKGPGEIRSAFEKFTGRPEYPGRQHHVSEIVMRGNAIRCEATSYASATQQKPDGTVAFVFAGSYTDVCVKVGSQWLFQERIFKRWGGDVLARFKRGV